MAPAPLRPLLTTARIPLPRPPATNPAELLVRYTVPIITVHILALLVFVPAFFSWTSVILCVAGVHVFGQTITMGYHRLLAHRSFNTPRWFEHTLVLGALCCLEDSPARWTATHRMHHAHSDEAEDPHSPLVTFLWGHVWWVMLRNRDLHHRTNYDKYARDILRDPFYMWIEQHAWSPLWFYLAQCAIYVAAGFTIALAWTDVTGAALFAASVLVWGVFLRTVIVWHITWSVNSLTHMFGYRNHDTEEHSQNNWLVALVAAGEGWHNNHHADPACCTNQHRWWELDVTYWELRAMSLIGLTSDLSPRREVRAAAAIAAAAARTKAKLIDPAAAPAGNRGDSNATKASVGAGAADAAQGNAVHSG